MESLITGEEGAEPCVSLGWRERQEKTYSSEEWTMIQPWIIKMSKLITEPVKQTLSQLGSIPHQMNSNFKKNFLTRASKNHTRQEDVWIFQTNVFTESNATELCCSYYVFGL